MNVAADMMSGSGDFHEYDGIGSSKCEADARSIYKGLSFSSSASSHEHTVSAEPLDEERYNMAHPNRGTCVIFNNQVFQPHTNLSERRGSDRDEENLSHQFGNLGFRVFVYTDLTCRDICSKLDKLGKQNYSGDDCFVCCILTHGGDGVLYGSDGKFPVDRVFKPFLDSACPTLRGKPKLFFIQACRGTQLDDGVVVALDTADSSLGAGPMLTDPDFLVAYSTVDGFYSWRNQHQGSWFMQVLCAVLSERGQSDHLLSMLTLVCHHVAIRYTSDESSNPLYHKKKQVPCITSTLTQLLYFPRRQALMGETLPESETLLRPCNGTLAAGVR